MRNSLHNCIVFSCLATIAQLLGRRSAVPGSLVEIRYRVCSFYFVIFAKDEQWLGMARDGHA